MKKTLYLILMLVALGASKPLLAQQLTFSYDAAGNQTARNSVCINCINGGGTASAPSGLSLF